MNTTNVSKITPNKPTPKNGTGSPDHPESTAASATPAAPSATTAPAPDKKPITVMVTESLHRKAKITAELSGVSLSDLIEAQLRVVVKERLPGLLSQLGDEP
jgi:hypothetical protein